MKDLSCINLFALDNGNWCQCEKCKDYSMSYRQLMLAYHLDKAIKKATEEGRIARKIRITIPAYHETLPPPDRALPDDFDYDTITITFYVIERCYVHDFNDEKCVETNKMLYDRLSQWVNGYYKGKFTIGEYYNVSSFASMPFLLTERMFHDMPFYYSIGVRSMKYMHMTASNRGVRALNDYVYAKLLWSISYDQEVLKREYYISKYGEYADKMRQIYEELECTCANCKLIKHYQYLDGKNRSLATELNKKKVTIFSYNHMKFEGRADDYQAGPSLTETVNRFETCFNEFCEFIKGKDYTIFEEDFEQLEYGLYTLKYLYYNALQSWDGDAQVGEQITYFAEKLKKITKPFEGYDVRGHLFENALKASRVVYEQ